MDPFFYKPLTLMRYLEKDKFHFCGLEMKRVQKNLSIKIKFTIKTFWGLKKEFIQSDWNNGKSLHFN